MPLPPHFILGTISSIWEISGKFPFFGQLQSIAFNYQITLRGGLPDGKQGSTIYDEFVPISTAKLKTPHLKCVLPKLRVRLKKYTVFIRFSLFFALKTAGVFLRFSHVFFHTALNLKRNCRRYPV
jgi:hypothetical protein